MDRCRIKYLLRMTSLFIHVNVVKAGPKNASPIIVAVALSSANQFS